MINDYQIFQRNKDGYAIVKETGKLPDEFEDGNLIACRVVREEDNLTVVDWLLCDIYAEIWCVTLRIPQGGLYRVEVFYAGDNDNTDWDGKKRIKLVRHIGVGDVYLLTGQSNMSGYGKDPAYDPPSLGVHLYGNNGKWSIAAHPFSDSVDTLYPENAEHCGGTSPSLSFARKLKEALNIPIGLIHTSLGGSSVSDWHPEKNGGLYRAMLRRLEIVGDVKGVLWYQGCTETMLEIEDAENYFENFKSMVRLWREQIGNVPFITVQLNRWLCSAPEIHDRRWGMVRDAQRRAALEIDDVYIVTTTDLGISDGIHNCSFSNVVIGERMARTVLCELYGMQGQTAPNILSAEYIDEMHIRVNIQSDNKVVAIEKSGEGFNIEDKSGLINCTNVESDFYNKCLIVTSEHPFTLPAKFHAIWRCVPPQFVPKSINGMPLVSCYNMEIKKV